jgi:hypothetical protein
MSLKFLAPAFDDEVLEGDKGSLTETSVDLLGDCDVYEGDWEGYTPRETRDSC